MTIRAAPRLLLFVWLAVLAGPVAWSASLATMFWLTHPVCQGLPHWTLTLTGTVCIIVALAGSLAAGRMLRRAPARPVEDSGDVTTFLLRLGLWGGLLFALVIALSLVPVALLTPCPV